jgi:hypothetical protein
MVAGTADAVEPSVPADRISFNRDIRPILSDTCFACHGPDSANRQAGLRLDVFEQATAELDSGARAIVPEEVTASELLARVTSDDPDTMMPPPEAKIGRLTPEQVDLLRRWVAQGAAYEPHWAFLPVAPPNLPATAADASLTHPIDRIVAAGLAPRGFLLQPEADRTTLVRRATFDVTGLPPTPAEVAAFVADDAPDAYERLLERLLASPRYGERMAADWLDLARYADSYGFQVDRERPMWRWRDWVISAFNRNLPWDDFVTWQVAGDLLPHASDEQMLATAFNRLHQQESEGGSVEEEYRVTYVNDRVTTFGTAFLGLTLECCRCHDHKFDPLSQREFYELFAFFDDVDEAGLYSYFTPAVPTPKLRVLDEQRSLALARAEEAVALATTDLARAEAAAREAVTAWRSGQAPAPAARASATAASTTHPIPGALVHYPFDERRPDGRFASAVVPPGTAPSAGAAPSADAAPAKPDDRAATSSADTVVVAGRHGGAVRLTGDHAVQTPVGNFRRSEPFTVSLWLQSPEAFGRAVIFHRSRAWTDAGSRGYELLVVDGHLQWSLIHFWPGDAASIRNREPLPLGAWVHVAVTSDGSGTAAGLAIAVDGRPAATEVVADTLTREITGGGGDTIAIGERFRDHGFKGGLVDDFRVFDRALALLEIRELVAPGAIARAIESRDETEALAAWHAAALDATAAAARQALEDARRARDDVAEQAEEVMVMRESARPRVAYVLERGDYDKRREAVEPGTPAALPPFPADQPRNRLGLARWLTAPDHPLLARVTVNRVWQALFGLGLVKSPEDLGSQAPRPEYPELLDWLAWSFARPAAEGGLDWDMKALLETIMTSRVYRQRSLADARTLADDPLNAWLARGPRHRLPAEMIRDGALFAAGLLVETIGGPPVKTYDMPESFKPAAADTGAALFRRSLYTHWRRTGPAPVLESFDVPKRVVCVARRDITNTPLHAFVLLNGPQFVEAARVLAERLLLEHGLGRVAADETPAAGGPALQPGVTGTIDDLLGAAFERLTSRRPDGPELDILRRMHAAQRGWYAARPEEAARLVAVGATRPEAGLEPVDVAAAAAVVNALLNYDGCVVKR